MSRASIVIPENRKRVTFQDAVAHYVEGYKVLVVLSDELGMYAAHAFHRDWGNLDLVSREGAKYSREGEWYVLEE